MILWDSNARAKGLGVPYGIVWGMLLEVMGLALGLALFFGVLAVVPVSQITTGPGHKRLAMPRGYERRHRHILCPTR